MAKAIKNEVPATLAVGRLPKNLPRLYWCADFPTAFLGFSRRPPTNFTGRGRGARERQRNAVSVTALDESRALDETAKPRGLDCCSLNASEKDMNHSAFRQVGTPLVE